MIGFCVGYFVSRFLVIVMKKTYPDLIDLVAFAVVSGRILGIY